MVAADVTRFLLPSSRLPTDVTFIVGEYPVSAPKGLLAAAHIFFDKMFYGAGKESGTSRVKVRWLKYINLLILFFEGGG